ncbi:prolipoprotein diacylglyceryl transferase [Candidatus Izemoplasma sp. B36]|uniref:prolipoprotein diacylglyceryl transferase n=1 Tax=Candidatus Izemoplasma sp. B36 TaxID=3242468 RepID=UPI0035586919
MNKFIKITLILILSILTVSLIGCDNSVPATDSYTVSFVDYDGTVLKTVDCTVGEACEILPPEDPDYFDGTDSAQYFTRWSMFESEFDSIDRDTTIEAIYTLDNRLITIGDRSIVMYSFFIIMGIMIALFLGLREAKRTGIDKDKLLDGFLWIVPVAILGARLWYVAFEWSSFAYGGFFPSLLRILGFRTGTLDFSSFGLSGLAIHGAFVVAIICAFFYCKLRKIDIFKVVDLVAIGFIIAQASGRWGNFFNQEAHGSIVGGVNAAGQMNLTLEAQYNFLKNTLHLPSFIVNNMYIVRGLHSVSTEQFTGFYHPTFFYESSINVIGFFIMLVLRRWKKIHFGELLSFYLIWYGGLRIFIETLRTDPLTFDIFGITMKSAIVTSVIMILLGIGLSAFIRLTRKGKTYATVPGYFGYKKDKEKETEETEK